MQGKILIRLWEVWVEGVGSVAAKAGAVSFGGKGEDIDQNLVFLGFVLSLKRVNIFCCSIGGRIYYLLYILEERNQPVGRVTLFSASCHCLS